MDATNSWGLSHFTTNNKLMPSRSFERGYDNIEIRHVVALITIRIELDHLIPQTQ